LRVIPASKGGRVSDEKQLLTEWKSPPHDLVLSAGAVHVWLVADVSLASSALREDVLSDDERARAARLSEGGRLRFSGARAALRSLLARYSGRTNEEIAFSYGPLGKPELLSGDIHFSVSHARDRAVLALSRTHTLGIDLEGIRGNRRFDALTARFFSPATARVISSASSSALPRIFTEAWSQREAYVKAVGGGLYATSDDLPFEPGHAPLRHAAAADGSSWTIFSVDAGREFECKLVARGDVGRIECYSFAALPPGGG
jgi:4'-phosphopantetheinyl transferase